MSYYSTSEFAQELGVNPQTVRLWDAQGKLKPHHRTPGGKRFYSQEQLDEFKQPAVIRVGGKDIKLSDFEELKTSDLQILLDKVQETLKKAENR